MFALLVANKSDTHIHTYGQAHMSTEAHTANNGKIKGGDYTCTLMQSCRNTSTLFSMHADQVTKPC